MSSLIKKTREIEAKLHSLLADLQELKEQIRNLEEENALLRQEMDVFHPSFTDRLPDDDQQESSLENLLELYDQGYHICNVRFGEKRKEGCLFCMAFLRRKGE